MISSAYAIILLANNETKFQRQDLFTKMQFQWFGECGKYLEIKHT